MKNTKLIQLLGTFTTAEMNELGKFVRSPFHNESPKMIKLYDALKKYHPDFENKKFTKENIFSMIYSSRRLGVPATVDDVFDGLLKKGVLPKKAILLAEEMKGMRNVLVHKYGEIDDARVYVFLTEKGKQAAMETDRIFIDVEIQAFKGISKEEQKKFMTIFRKVCENIIEK